MFKPSTTRLGCTWIPVVRKADAASIRHRQALESSYIWTMNVSVDYDLRPAASSSNRAMWQLSTECAPCFRATTLTRSNTLPASLKVARIVRRMLACAFFVGEGELRRVVSSAPRNPAADDARRNTRRVLGPVQLRLATPNPAVASPAVGCYESDPVDVITARSAQE